MTSEESSAKGRAYARTAAENQTTNPNVARKLYLKAAESFNDAAGLTSKTDEREEYLKYSNHFLELSKTCKPQAQLISCPPSSTQNKLLFTQQHNPPFCSIRRELDRPESDQ